MVPEPLREEEKNMWLSPLGHGDTAYEVFPQASEHSIARAARSRWSRPPTAALLAADDMVTLLCLAAVVVTRRPESAESCSRKLSTACKPPLTPSKVLSD